MTTTAPAPVTRYYDLVDANDVDGLVALFTPDATYERPGYEPMRGHSGLTAFYSGERIIASGAHTLTHTVVDGDEVAVQGRFAVAGTHAGRVEHAVADDHQAVRHPQVDALRGVVRGLEHAERELRLQRVDDDVGVAQQHHPR